MTAITASGRTRNGPSSPGSSTKPEGPPKAASLAVISSTVSFTERSPPLARRTCAICPLEYRVDAQRVGFTSTCGHGDEGGGELRLEIVDVLDPDADPHQPVADTERGTLLRAQRPM